MAGEWRWNTQADGTYGLARVYIQGLAAGMAAAVADSPDFLCYSVMLDTAWEESSAWPDVRPLAEQEEYFVAWVHGYVQRADEIEDAQDTGHPPGGKMQGRRAPRH